MFSASGGISGFPVTCMHQQDAKCLASESSIRTVHSVRIRAILNHLEPHNDAVKHQVMVIYVYENNPLCRSILSGARY